MPTFMDREGEPLGTRQKRWLDFLQTMNDYQSLKVCHEYEKRKYSKWEDAEMCVCPIDHRSILKNESVIEFDNDNRLLNVALIESLKRYLDQRNIKNYIQDHNGRSPHLHAFDMGRIVNLNLLRNKILIHDRIDFSKLKGKGLCREIGGCYFKEDEKFYASWFEKTTDIKPVVIHYDVRFPKW